MPKKQKGRRTRTSSSYTKEDLVHAVNAVRCNNLSLRKASEKYGVPVMTIQNRVSGQVDDMASAGRPTVFPSEVEENIVKKIKTAAEQGFGLTRQMLAVRVSRVVRRLGIKTPFRNGIPGKDWLSGFVKRHPDISLRTPVALSTVRARMLNPTVTARYFEELTNIVHLLNQENVENVIWNMDETSVPLLHKPSRVLAATGSKNIPGRVGNSRDNVSVLACVNAGGRAIPPMAIVKGKTYKSLHAYNTKAGVPGAIYTYQQRAWMEDVLGEMWFKDHFLRHCGDTRPQLIILDSHSSHETLSLIDAARENNIHLLAFPPHTTQWLCPLDKSIFGPLSREYNRICSEFMAENPNNLVNKWEWPRLFCQAYVRSFTPDNIKSGFRKCGISPLNPTAVPCQAFAPSQPFDQPLTCNKENNCQGASAVESVSNIVNNFQPTSSNVVTACTNTSPDPGTHTCSSSSVSDNQTDVTTLATCSASSQNISPKGSFDILSEEDILQSVIGGEIPFSIGESGTINFELPIAETATPTATVNADYIPSFPDQSNHAPLPSEWSSEVENMFRLPPPLQQKKAPSVKKLTSHRILTSDQIYELKCLDLKRKQNEIDEKAKRKLARETKKNEKKCKK